MDLLSNTITFYILIVDDSKDDHLLLRKALDKVIPQAIVESIYDGDEALEYLDKCTSFPNLIFLDLKMTKLSGQATLKQIRKNEVLNHVPVIILTGTKNEVEKKELIAQGATDFYSKPDDSKELVKIVKNIKNKWLD